MGNNFPVLEPVVPEGFDDRIVLFSQYDISFIKKFDNKPVDMIAFSDIKNKYTL